MPSPIHYGRARPARLPVSPRGSCLGFLILGLLAGLFPGPQAAEAHPPGLHGRGHAHGQELAPARLEGAVTSLPISAKLVSSRRGRELYFVNGTYYRRFFYNQQTVYVPVGTGPTTSRLPRSSSAAIPFDAASHQRQYQSVVVTQVRRVTRNQQPQIIIIVAPPEASGTPSTVKGETLLVSAP